MEKTKSSRFLLCVLIFQIVFLCLVPFLFPWQNRMDSDGAVLYNHAVEMWKNRTLFLPDWNYKTTLEIDCASLLALPLYGLTHDIGLSFCIANVFFILGYAVLIVSLVRRMGFSLSSGFVAAVFVLLPYGYGELDYWQMMFLNGSQYTIKVLLPVLFVFLLLAPKEKQCSLSHRLLILLFLFLCFLTAFSSGIYEILCGFAGIFLCEIWIWLHQSRPPEKYKIFLSASALVSSLAGLVFIRRTGFHALGNSMELVTVSEAVSNLQNCFLGLFNLLGAITEESTPVLSLDGIRKLLLVCFVIFLLGCAVRSLVRLIKAKSLYPGEGELAAVFWLNLFVLLNCSTSYGEYFEYRYHLIGLIPLFILAAISIGNFVLCQQEKMKSASKVIVCLGLFGLAFLVDFSQTNVLRKLTYGEPSDSALICSYLQENAVSGELIVLNSNEISNVCRVIDPDNHYVWYDTDGLQLFNLGSYQSDAEAANLPTEGLWFCDAGLDISSLPSDYISHCTLADTLGDEQSPRYSVYRFDHLKLDGSIGLSFGNFGIDYPDSRHYTTVGTIDDDRRLYADSDGTVLYSGHLDLYTVTDVSVFYQRPENIGDAQLEIWDANSNTMLSAVPLPAEAENISYSGLTPGLYQLRITLSGGASILVDHLEFHQAGSPTGEG